MLLQGHTCTYNRKCRNIYKNVCVPVTCDHSVTGNTDSMCNKKYAPISFSSKYRTVCVCVCVSSLLETLTLILPRSRTRTVWFYTFTSNKRAARPKLYTKSLTRDLKRMYSRLTLVRISINL